MTTATATKFIYTIYTPMLEYVDNDAFTTTYETDEYITAADLIDLPADENIKWTRIRHGEFPLAADGGWFVELETEGEGYELTPFQLENEQKYDPSSMTLEEVKAIYAELAEED